MPRVIFGRELPVQGERRIRALTMGQLLEALREQEPSLTLEHVICYVNGRDHRTLERDATPLGDEDIVLLTGRRSR